MKKLANFFKKDNKGFTLVEIIVVLAILAILIAVALPSMTGILNESKAKVIMTDARAALVALQVKLTDTPVSGINGATVLELIDKVGATTITVEAVFDDSVEPARVTHLIYGDTAKVDDKVIMITLLGGKEDKGTVYADVTTAKAAVPTAGTWTTLLTGAASGGSSTT